MGRWDAGGHYRAATHRALTAHARHLIKTASNSASTAATLPDHKSESQLCGTSTGTPSRLPFRGCSCAYCTTHISFIPHPSPSSRTATTVHTVRVIFDTTIDHLRKGQADDSSCDDALYRAKQSTQNYSKTKPAPPSPRRPFGAGRAAA